MRVVIAEDGTVEEAEAKSGAPPFTELAEEAARRWQFQPLFVDGQATRVESTLTFRIER